jgi:hypothetical protein
MFSDATQSISIGAAASVEGFIALAVPDVGHQNQPTLVIPSSVRVVGCVLSTGRSTLDGTVIGTVLTRDFEFYEAPTQYLGWLRSGRIDRTALPPSFLLPPGLSGTIHLDVLDWL